MTYLVSYTASGLEEKNVAMINCIKSFPRWAILNYNTFIISHTEEQITEIRNRLNEYCKPDDSLVIFQLQRIAAWKLPSQELREWLTNNIQ